MMKDFNYKSKFRNKMNQLITRDLFIEVSIHRNLAIYSLDRKGKEGYINLYEKFMEKEDLTGFEFALEYFDSFNHWKKITQTPWFAEIYSEWMEELELKIRARALKMLIDKSTDSTDVAKYLLNNKWVEKAQINNPAVNLRGRPSKEEIRKHLTLITMEEKQVEDDYERIKA